MSLGLIGKKCGMTRVFMEDGESVPVTVVDVSGNRISQIKTIESDGYCAVQLCSGQVKSQRLDKSLQGHFAKAGIEAGSDVVEFRMNSADVDARELGASVGADTFSEGQVVDVSGVSKGKGFAGAIKRWNFSRNGETHGVSLAHRSAGSIGQNQTPGRVFKGKKMAGHMGNVKKTQQNLSVVRVDSERQLVLIKGSVPGSTGGTVVIRPAIKTTLGAG